MPQEDLLYILHRMQLHSMFLEGSLVIHIKALKTISSLKDHYLWNTFMNILQLLLSIFQKVILLIKWVHLRPKELNWLSLDAFSSLYQLVATLFLFELLQEILIKLKQDKSLSMEEPRKFFTSIPSSNFWFFDFYYLLKLKAKGLHLSKP